MKKLIYLFSIAIALTAFTATSASAQTDNGVGNDGINNGKSDHDGQGTDNGQGNDGQNNGNGNQGNNGQGNDGSSSTTAALPINGGVAFLMIAGVTIGIVSVKKYRAVKPATTQE